MLNLEKGAKKADLIKYKVLFKSVFLQFIFSH